MVGPLVAVFVCVALWSYDPLREGWPRRIWGLCCFLAAATAGSFAIEAGGRAWIAVMLVIATGVAGMVSGAASRRLIVRSARS